MPAIQLAVNLVPILAGVGLKYLFFKKKGFARDYAAGVKEGLATVKRYEGGALLYPEPEKLSGH